VDQSIEESGWLAELKAQEESRTLPEHRELVHQAWLRTVNRPPTAPEISRAIDHLANADSLQDGLRDLLWALINTREFVLIK
jgi:hypothetical protein